MKSETDPTLETLKSPQKRCFTLDSPYTLVFLSLLIGFFYITCSTPLNGWRDGPEFSVTATYLDVAHPSGFPTFNLLAKIATWIPLGSLGFRVTVFTAIVSALSLFLMASLLIRLHGLDKDRAKSLPFLLAPILAFALDRAVFVSSTELEVYSLHTFFLILLFYCATRWHEGSGIKWLFAGGFLYGLSSGNHGSMCLYLPVLLLLTFYGEPAIENDGKKSRHLKRLGFLILFFLIGLSVYLFLLIRSGTEHLPVDFGRTYNLERLWYHISDAKDAEYHFKGVLNQNELLFLIKIQISNLTSPIFWLTIPFFIWGLRYLWLKFQILSVAAILLILINLGFFYYWVDGSAAFIPSICTYIIVTALGVGELGRRLTGKAFKPLVSAALALIMVVQVVSMGKDRLSERDTLSGYQSVEFYFHDLAAVPPDSILAYSAGWFAVLSLQYVYATRPDLTIVLMSSLYQPEFMAYPRPQNQPYAFFPKAQDGSLISPTEENYAGLFFATNAIHGKRIFLQYGQEVSYFLPYLEPTPTLQWMGELIADSSTGQNALDNGSYTLFLKRSQQYFESIDSDPNFPPATKLLPYLFYINRTVLDYTYKNHLYDITGETIKKFLDIFAYKNGKQLLPYDIILNSYALYANACRHQQNYKEAEDAVMTLLKVRPNYDITYILQGLIYDIQNKGQEALNSFQTAYTLNPDSRNAAQRYAYALAKYKSLSDAIHFLDNYIQFLDKEQLYNSKNIMTYQKQCLLLDPTLPELPQGNLLLQLYFKGMQHEASDDD
jgi:hypothetical protein